jgi:molybdopterin-containing oxidoreductase family membrane subunit
VAPAVAEKIPEHMLEPPLIEGPQTDRKLTDSILHPVWRDPQKGWLMLISITGTFLGILILCITYLILTGVGVWGNNSPVYWAFDIINFVWWVGIGHAGTLISAILLLFQQGWRTSINRFAEAMTLFAVICAAMYPGLHTGRPWFAAYWLVPIPNTMQIWPNFKSPLVWDVFAISTYFTVSLLFWYVGLVPDLATLRDASASRTRRFVYGIFALGWRGSATHWHNWKWAYMLLAGISTPLVLSVHTIVSFDFATSILPGWHTTIFPPYFVAGAVFSGFAMVLSLMIPARVYMGLKHVITMRHIENMCKVILVTGWMVTFGYLCEMFADWYSGSVYEIGQLKTRFLGPYWPLFWLLLFCNCVVPNLFWMRSMRRNLAVVWIVALLVNVGMWLERFVIVVISLHQDFIPASWGMYKPTIVDIGMLTGSLGLFGTAFLLFLKFVPAVALAEVKELRHDMEHEAHAKEHDALAEAH